MENLEKIILDVKKLGFNFHKTIYKTRVGYISSNIAAITSAAGLYIGSYSLGIASLLITSAMLYFTLEKPEDK
ncbi:MAG: hypothetical protein M1348_00525 [Candidatus Parvarchaeota archaeon]|jgi:hypothetical protein|nr:hypothetical protein [Candidatus Parvarchaeota archaeon]MCL5101083.1 hypothetical protein [Candidatus Parvarchaeota archaeon]